MFSNAFSVILFSSGSCLNTLLTAYASMNDNGMAMNNGSSMLILYDETTGEPIMLGAVLK